MAAKLITEICGGEYQILIFKKHKNLKKNL